ncbi:MAG: electron transport complex subunit RsxD [Gammaproteobacteria bacterium CG22_combo_CG10-13_8_21_14_all_40_8]|nr:MAG: electron transport complex subunit RsxD [Gammaproteobacteria bacterium CG22_combo_CG10-13_8_21_14_all_40_8]
MLYKTSAPRFFSENRVSGMMLTLIAAAIPGLFAQTYFFGWGVLIQVIFAIIVALISEVLVLFLRNKPIISTLFDGSAIVTGFLLGLALPSVAPWWITFTAVTFAMIFAKHLYGGLGYNPFNPAMVGYVLVLISFPLQMTAWLPATDLLLHPLTFMDSLAVIFNQHTANGFSVANLRTGIDGYTLATPLDTIKTDLNNGFMLSEILQKSIFGDFAGKGWGLVNLCYLLGGIFLIIKKVINWRIPFSFLGTLLLFSVIFTLINPNGYTSPILHLFSGATMIGAFFIATDPVSASTTPRGRIYFGIGIGLLVFVIRTFGGYPDAIAFAVLLMNMCAPTIDQYTQPKIYGQRTNAQWDLATKANSMESKS